MFGTLIDIDTDGNVFLHDKSVALLPEMWKVYKNRRLGSKAVKWIVSMYDLASPYRRFPEQSREEMVNAKILESTECTFKKNKDVLSAIEEYRKLQYDPLIYEYQSMVNKSYEIMEVYKNMKITKDNIKEANDIQKSIGQAAQSRTNIKEMLIKQQNENVQISGMDNTDDLSLFEQEDLMD